MSKLLHISDLHFGRPFRPEVGEAVHRLAAQLAVDAVVVSGDIVQWAESRTAWTAAKAFLERFAAPLLTVPGNHDIARIDLLTRLRHPAARYQEFLNQELDQVLTLEDATVVGLATPRRWTPELGHLSASQLAFARHAFRNRDAMRVVVMHHGLVRGSRPLRDCVRGKRRAQRAFADMGVDLVLTGHNHYPRVKQLAQAGGLVWSQAGTATSSRFRLWREQRNSVSVVFCRPDTIGIEWWFFDAASGAFAREAVHEFDRRREVTVIKPGRRTA